jgi:hypothetical protein
LLPAVRAALAKDPGARPTAAVLAAGAPMPSSNGTRPVPVEQVPTQYVALAPVPRRRRRKSVLMGVGAVVLTLPVLGLAAPNLGGSGSGPGAVANAATPSPLPLVPAAASWGSTPTGEAHVGPAPAMEDPRGEWDLTERWEATLTPAAGQWVFLPGPDDSLLPVDGDACDSRRFLVTWRSSTPVESALPTTDAQDQRTALPSAQEGWADARGCQVLIMRSAEPGGTIDVSVQQWDVEKERSRPVAPKPAPEPKPSKAPKAERVIPPAPDITEEYFPFDDSAPAWLLDDDKPSGKGKKKGRED